MDAEALHSEAERRIKETLVAHGDAYRAAERAGIEAAQRCAFVLVAGGLGERLGYGGIKDTNAFALRSCVANCGVSAKLDLDYNSSCVARKPGEAIGAICRLDRPRRRTPRTPGPDAQRRVQPARAALASVGEADDPTPSGASRFPGNINQLLIKLGGDDAATLAVLQRTGRRAAVPEFVNPKYADDTKTAFKKPTRLECMMQDYPKLLSSNAKVGFTVLERAAVRGVLARENATADGAAKVRAGLAGACPATGEADLYAFNCDLLSVGGMDVAPASGGPTSREERHLDFREAGDFVVTA
ncbi:synapse-associated protein [Aureococcus anophagefferens]|uniref:Synapse-associated protein n=1 Tax=Aureococcus anophagefferens TaxID=44056 RepID=A0ABR1FVK8_AURAN